MSEKLMFHKLHGLGNSYIYFDCTKAHINPEIIIKNIEKISDKNFGIGSDGVILLLPSENADLRMRIFNADAGEAEMCGNGVRAFARLAHKLKLINDTATIETKGGNVEVELLGDEVRVKMFYPPKVSSEKEQVDGFDFYRVDMGNPHAIINVDGVDNYDVEGKGRPIENNTSLFPERTNVEFYEEVSPGIVKMRVWERGSGETQACGTGACATAGAYRLANDNKYNEVTVKMLGGALKMSWEGDAFYMQGPATFVCEGVIDLGELS